jgi:hypothetical protein
MPGFFKIDIDDYDEFWSLRQNQGLFTVYAALERRAWRQDKPRQVFERHYRITLWRNQLILNIRKLSLQIDLAESTLRDRLGKLETMEAIRTDKPVPEISVITNLWTYDYAGQGERTPCIYRAPTVVDLLTNRDHLVQDPLLEPCSDLPNSDLQPPYTKDSRLEDSENQNRLVRREMTLDRDSTDERSDMADDDSPSEADIEAQVTEICELLPGAKPDQVLAYAARERRS